MFRARLEFGNSFIEIGAEVLADLVNCLPPRYEASDLFEELVKCPNSKLRKAVARKSGLLDQSVTLLANDKSQEVLIALIENDDASPRIPPSRIEELISADDSEILRTIFENLEHLSQVDAEKIVGQFSDHEDALIRLEVARSFNTRVDVLHHLARDRDRDVRDAALSTIRNKCSCCEETEEV